MSVVPSLVDCFEHVRHRSTSLRTKTNKQSSSMINGLSRPMRIITFEYIWLLCGHKRHWLTSWYDDVTTSTRGRTTRGCTKHGCPGNWQLFQRNVDKRSQRQILAYCIHPLHMCATAIIAASMAVYTPWEKGRKCGIESNQTEVVIYLLIGLYLVTT